MSSRADLSADLSVIALAKEEGLAKAESRDPGLVPQAGRWDYAQIPPRREK